MARTVPLLGVTWGTLMDSVCIAKCQGNQAAGKSLSAACCFPLPLTGANGKIGDLSIPEYWEGSNLILDTLWLHSALHMDPTQSPNEGIFRLKFDSDKFLGLVSKMNGIKQSYGWTR